MGSLAANSNGILRTPPSPCLTPSSPYFPVRHSDLPPFFTPGRFDDGIFPTPHFSTRLLSPFPLILQVRRSGPSPGHSGPPVRFPSSVHILTPGLTSEYPICTVCVCARVYAHLHPHTLPPALKIEKTQTTPLSLLLSKITPHTKQKVPSYTSWTPPSSFPNAE